MAATIRARAGATATGRCRANVCVLCIRLRSVSARCHLTACVVILCLCLSPGCHLTPYAVRSRVVSHVVVRQSFMSLLLGSLLTSAASLEAAE